MEKKIGGVILTHGQLANGLLTAAETVVGEIPFITAVSIGWHDDVETARDEITRAIKQVSKERGVLILTDMFGGAPTNIAAMFLGADIEILTGVNLPMVIRLAKQPEGVALADIAQQVMQQGREEIYLASELLAPVKPKK